MGYTSFRRFNLKKCSSRCTRRKVYKVATPEAHRLINVLVRLLEHLAYLQPVSYQNGEESP
jgi:hypothetical protein